MSDIAISLLLLLGTLLVLISVVGLIRFPDVYNRVHATGMSSTLGLVLILVAGTAYFSIRNGFTLKILLVIPFLFWTASAGAFMITRAALRTGPNLARETVQNDLAIQAGTVDVKE